MRESDYQAYLVKELYRRFPGCIVLKNDSSYLQGIPDLLILWHARWAMLEVKASRTSRRQPNQQHYVDYLNEMSFASFIDPSTEKEVLRDLQFSLSTRRAARVPQRF